MHHLPVIYQHLTEKEKVALEHITKMACKLSKIELPSLLTTVSVRIKTQALQMVGGSSSPVHTLATLPSGRYKTLQHRINCCNHCYRNVVAEFSTAYSWIGDYNARIGSDSKKWKGVLGSQGVGKCDAIRVVLLALCSEYRLVITNTIFKHKEAHKNTCMHPSSKLALAGLHHF